MIKSAYDYQSANFTGITNCLFNDGEATALNWQLGCHSVEGCTFTNVNEVEEFYESVATQPCLFENSTAIKCNDGITLNGAETNRQPQVGYYFQTNNFSVHGWGVNVSPAQNVVINANYFHDMQEGLLLCGVGGQGTASVSNIVFINNTCSNDWYMITSYSGGYIYITNNSLDGGTYGGFAAVEEGGGAGPCFFYNNTATNCRDGIGVDTTSCVLPYDDPSNVFPWHRDYNLVDNLTEISYAYGYRHGVVITNACFLDDTIPSQIPFGATMIVSNGCGSTVSLLGSAVNQVAPITLGNGCCVKFNWTNEVWQLVNVMNYLQPPSVLHVSGNN
jgi:hypothetical protein